MGLVDYSDSEGEDGMEATIGQPAPKKRGTGASQDLPPLPSEFLDLYSSKVRTSTRDDPSLHGGRKRLTPHVEGNWPTHVSLEWHPTQEDADVLSGVVFAAKTSTEQTGSLKDEHCQVHSLLQNDLGVHMPLHVSLSRPITLNTQQKDGFLLKITEAVRASRVRSFSSRTTGIRWHSNEDGSRCFLVLCLARPEKDELNRLLKICNEIVATFDQPTLYTTARVEPDDQKVNTSNADTTDADVADSHERFHVSLAWSLRHSEDTESTEREAIDEKTDPRDRLASLHISFAELKVRIGQNVTSIGLLARRSPTTKAS